MTLSPLTRWFLIVVALVSAVVALNRIVSPFSDADLYDRDFIQEHLIAQAWRSGDDPYRPLPELAAKYLAEPPKSLPWNHECPHPPPAVLAFIPIGLLPYRVGKVVWLIVELACLAGFVEMMSRWWGAGIRWWEKGLAICAALSFGPVISELWNGQFSLVLLVLLAAAWLGLRSGGDAAGGCLLGVAIALKWTAWPIGIFLLLRRHWTAVFVCAAVVLLANALGVAVLGWDAVERYYTVIGPGVARDYRQHLENYSFWSVSSRVFGVVPFEGGGGFVTQSLAPNETLERIVKYALPALMLVVALTLALRCRSFDSSYGILMTLGLPINPVIWDHYLLLTALPITICLRRLMRVGFTPWTGTLVLVGLGVSILLPHAYLDKSVELFKVPDERYDFVLPFLPGLVTYLPLVPIGIWTGLLWTTDAEAARTEGRATGGLSAGANPR